MRYLSTVLFLSALILSGCSDGLSLSSTSEPAEAAPVDGTTSTLASQATGDENGNGDSNDAGDADSDTADAGDTGDDEGSVTIEPRQARTDLTDPYCVDLESVFAASYDIEVLTVAPEQVGPFDVLVQDFGTAATAALEHAPVEHEAALLTAVDFANTYAGMSYEEAEAMPTFNDDLEDFAWLFFPDIFSEDVSESDFEDPAYVAVHASELCGVDVEVSYSIDFGSDGEFEFEFSGETSMEFGELEDFGITIDDIAFGCTVLGQREFEVDLSNSLPELLSFSGEVVFFDANGEATSGRSTFNAESVRPGERSAEIQDSDDPTAAFCEIEYMSWSRTEGIPIDPADTCSFSYDNGSIDVEVDVVSSDETSDWLNVRYGLSDADGVRLLTGLVTLENGPGSTISGTTFEFTEDDRFVSCEIVAKERL